MIEISHHEEQFTVTLTGSYPISNQAWTLKWNAGTGWAAVLLWQHFSDQLASRLNQIRRDAYAQGWKDAKGKKVAKQTWFSSSWKD